MQPRHIILSFQVVSRDWTPTLPEVAEHVLRNISAHSICDEYSHLRVIINDAFTDEPAVRLQIEDGLVTEVVPPIISTLALSTILNPERAAAAAEAAAAAAEIEVRERKQGEDFEKFLSTRYSDSAIREQLSRVRSLETAAAEAAAAAAEAILTAAENRDPVQLSQALTKLHGWTKGAEVVRQAALDYQDWEAAIVYARRLLTTVRGDNGMRPGTKGDLWYDTKTTIKWWLRRAARVLSRHAAGND